MILHNNFSDFILFLYVHMSHADNSYDPSEMAAIKGKMNDLYPEGTDLEKKLYRTIREYNSFDKSKLSALLEDSLTHFSSQNALKDNVYVNMNEIIKADGKIDQSETTALETLKQIIDYHAKNKGE